MTTSYKLLDIIGVQRGLLYKNNALKFEGLR